MTKIMFVTNDAWFFVSHRLPLAERAVRENMQAVVVAKADDKVAFIEQCGARFEPWAINPRSKSIFTEVATFVRLFKIIRRESPDIIHLITIKPVLYGGLISRVLGVRSAVFAISGLGAIFTAQTKIGYAIRLFITRLYRFAVNHPNSCLIFQNQEDRRQLLHHLRLQNSRTLLVRGSGADLSKFSVTQEPEGLPVFTLAARLLKDKGIGEFVDAAAILEQRGIKARYQVAGDMAGEGNPAAYSQIEIDALKAQSSVSFVGFSSDIPRLFAQSSVVVLPSYREGLPKVLIEAGAACRAVITTDVPGCRDAITPDETGLLVPAKDAVALADAMQRLADDTQLRRAMGKAGRELVKRTMRVEDVCDAHFSLYQSLLSQQAPSA